MSDEFLNTQSRFSGAQQSLFCVDFTRSSHGHLTVLKVVQGNPLTKVFTF